MTQQTALTGDQMELQSKLCWAVVCVIRKDAATHSKLDELGLACVQDVIFIFLLLTFSGASVGKYDTSGISSIIPRIQGHICFLVTVTKENSFCICNPMSRNREFICLAAACGQNYWMWLNLKRKQTVTLRSKGDDLWWAQEKATEKDICAISISSNECLQFYLCCYASACSRGHELWQMSAIKTALRALLSRGTQMTDIIIIVAEDCIQNSIWHEVELKFIILD